MKIEFSGRLRRTTPSLSHTQPFLPTFRPWERNFVGALLGAVEETWMRISTEVPFALFFIVLPFVGTCYAAYRNDHLGLLGGAIVIGLLAAGGLTLAEQRLQRRHKSDAMMRRLALWFLLLHCSPALAQGGLTIMPVTVTVSSGQRTVGLRTDARGTLSVRIDGQWQVVGAVDARGSLSNRSGDQVLELDGEGSLVTGGDTTPLRLDDNATLSLSGLDVLRVQSSTLIELEPIAHALPCSITGVRIESPPGGDKLAAYLVAVYVLLLDSN